MEKVHLGSHPFNVLLLDTRNKHLKNANMNPEVVLVTGLGGYYCPESNEFCPAGRAVGLPKKDGPVALKQLSVISAYSLRPKHQASLETTQGKGYRRIAEELITHQTDKMQTFICQALNKNCLVYVQCHSLNSSCYELRDELLQ